MKILIDGRFYGLENAGIGRYLINLIGNLITADNKNHYIILLKKNYYTNLNFPLNWEKVLADIPHYSLVEQFKLPTIINQYNPDLVFFPHFNVPVFYRGKYFVMIHDLIKHSSRGKNTTTRNSGVYWFKYLAYKFIFSQAVRRAAQIFVPSNYVKNDLVTTYKLEQKKVLVTYEGIDNHFTEAKIIKDINKFGIRKPYLIYAGSLYPHKNVDRLIEAVTDFNKVSKNKILLVLVCARNVFYKRMEEKIRIGKMEQDVKMLGFVEDRDLSALYRNSIAMVFPTLSEGFGLPGLEAMASETPVLCSDIPVLKEIYGEAALYFDPFNIKDMEEKIGTILNDKKTQKDLIDKGLKQIKKYSWEKMAKQIINSYEM